MLIIYKRGTILSRLARRLGIEVYFPTDDILIRRRNQLQPHVNWGWAGSLRGAEKVLNRDLSICRSKVKTFKEFQEAKLPHPRWSESLDELLRECQEGRTIFLRRDGLTGGEGITPFRVGEPIPEARWDFAVERVSCSRELRIHVFCGRVIAEQVKLVPPGNTNPIHSFKNGCTFSTQQLDRFLTPSLLERARSLCIKAVEAAKLDFGAVDLILNKREDFYLLEVNSAPGLRSEPVFTAYQQEFQKLVKRKISRRF